MQIRITHRQGEQYIQSAPSGNPGGSILDANPGSVLSANQQAILKIAHPIGGDRYAAHVFDIEGGIAFMDHGWAESSYGGGQPCHQLDGNFEVYPYEEGVWIALDTEVGDVIICTYDGHERQDGTRDKAREVLEWSLQVDIPVDVAVAT